MFQEHDRIVLTTAIPEKRLEPGDVGTIVHVYAQAAAYVVEFLSLDGNTVATATVQPSQARAVTSQDVSHARPIQLAI